MSARTKTRSIQAEAWTALLRPPGSWRAVVLAVVTLLVLTGAAGLMLGVAALTFFRARRLYSEVLATGVARVILRLWGIRVAVHQDRPFPATQTIYLTNHTSTIDLFVLAGLGLPRTRFFFTGFFRKLLPLGVISHLMGTFHTPPQTDRPARIRCFQRAERVLRRTGDAVCLSPEGERITTGSIGPFNKGAFHLATNLGAPIVPLYIDIPREIDPGKGYAAGPGTVDVYIGPLTSTRDWRLEDVDRHKAWMRERYLSFQTRLRAARAAGRPVDGWSWTEP